MVSSVVHGYIMGSEQRCSEAIQTQDWSQVGTDWGSEATMRGVWIRWRRGGRRALDIIPEGPIFVEAHVTACGIITRQYMLAVDFSTSSEQYCMYGACWRMVWSGLVWFGMVWFGLVWYSIVRLRGGWNYDSPRTSQFMGRGEGIQIQFFRLRRDGLDIGKGGCSDPESMKN